MAKLAAEYGWDAQVRKLIALYDGIGEEAAAKRFDRQTSGSRILMMPIQAPVVTTGPGNLSTPP